MIHQGFEPYINDDSRILILGSFPSVKSREEGFYYGNPQNRFWKIVAESFYSPLPTNIEEKKQLLSKNKIALWDIVISCEIKGSMDKDIKSPIIADVASIIARYPIRKIITNGGASRSLFIKHFPELAEMSLSLPSTSPANARLDKSLWINALREFQSPN